MTGLAKSFNQIHITTRRVIQMTFITKQAGLLRSARRWAARALVLTLLGSLSTLAGVSSFTGGATSLAQSPLPEAIAQTTRTINLNTGFDQWASTPAPIAVGGLDNEWRVITDPTSTPPEPPGNGVSTGRPANVVQSIGSVNPSLGANYPQSVWISVNPTSLAKPAGSTYRYAFYFTLPVEFSSPNLTMRLNADDHIKKVTLNSCVLFTGPGGSFGSSPLTITSNQQSCFNSGPNVNVLMVDVEDTVGGFTGLIVAGTVTYQDCDRQPINQIPDLTSITFWESTVAQPGQPPTAYTVGGPGLTAKLTSPLTQSNNDFVGVPNAEFYDVFYSNWDGTFNPTGDFVTIEAEFPNGAPSGGGLNIARVDLNFSSGPSMFANSVASFVALGDNALPAEVGKAVDGNLLTDTTMGNTIGQTQRLRVTVGFPCSCVHAPSGMVAWWPMDETSGATSLQDIVGGNNATPFASPVGAAQAPQAVSGVVNGAIDFPKFGNGLSGARVAPSGALVNIGAGDFTIDAWVKFPPSSAANKPHYIVNKFDATQNKGYALYIISPGTTGNERLEFKWGDGAPGATVQTIAPPITPNQWHHVAVVFARNVGPNALDIRLYVDGVQQGMLVGGTPPGSLVNFLFLEIGQQPSTIDEPITIDELEIFNRALSQAEIQTIFGAQSEGKCKPQPPSEPTADLGDAPDSTNHPNKPMTAYSSPLVPAKFPTVFDPATGSAAGAQAPTAQGARLARPGRQL
jgi:hypothetical protein